MMSNQYSIFSRILHWGFALFFAFAYLSSENLPFYLHLIAGLGFGVLLFVKLYWMFASQDLANIKQFHFAGITEFVKKLLKKEKAEQNHNPLSSVVSVLILLSGILTLVSGVMFLFDKEFWFIYGHDLKEVHEFFANLTLGLVLIHVMGVVSDAVIFKHRTYKTMFTGEKTIGAKTVQGIGLLGVFGAAAFWVYGIFSTVPSVEINKQYQKECASCHFAYPKELYSAKSWQNIMSNLGNHYGDNAEIDENSKREILAYLTSGTQSQKFKTSFGDFEIDGIDGSIATNEKFKRVHRHLPKDDVKPSCDKCHTDAASGLYRLANIRPKKEDDGVKNYSDRR